MPAGPGAERHHQQNPHGLGKQPSSSSSSSAVADPLGASVSASAPAQQQQDTEPLACISCRARKLKCDRTKPACGRCAKVDNQCVYPESRRKPAFKRRNVKELEARLGKKSI
jgi:hypothetical protein